MDAVTAVTDCSILVDVLVGPDQEIVHEALGDLVLHAPAHVDVEVVSALRGLVLGRHLMMPRARDALADLGDLSIHRWQLDRAMALASLALADNVTAYDASYVVLAQGLDCPLLTRDHRLACAAGSVVEVHTI